MVIVEFVVEIMGLILACCEGYRSTHDECWIREARRCLDWFLGRNDLRVPMADFRTGGSYDGLQPEGVNLNEGAESTVAWVISLLAVHEISATKLAGDPKQDAAAANGVDG